MTIVAGIGMRLAVAALLMVAAHVGCATAHADAGELHALIQQRLALMRDVAAHKWRHGQPIEDLEREALVMEQAVTDALRHGFTVASSRAFFAAQIEAAKEVQRYWFGVWESGSGSAAAAAADLDLVVRPQLLRLGSAIMAAAQTRREGPVSAAAEVVVDGLSPETRDRLLDAARDLERYPDRLRQVLDSRVLRVGTTGDYAPFSYRGDGDADYRGIDIDLAAHLAQALGVTVVFVPTSWPSLMADLAAGHYDIGMSGISRLVERQKQGFLSIPYYVSGKTPIARCDAAARFGSLAAVDQPGVRVVVNPGGTNEQFVDAHIRRARKVLHPDNRTIFGVLVDGGADVMITDRVEVDLQSALHDELCGTMPDDLNYQDKAYLMPQDAAWRALVDLWLELALADGTVAAVVARHGVEPRLPRGR